VVRPLATIAALCLLAMPALAVLASPFGTSITAESPWRISA